MHFAWEGRQASALPMDTRAGLQRSTSVFRISEVMITVNFLWPDRA